MDSKELQIVNNIQDMLKGCICRLCVTDNEKEFDEMYENAKGYLQTIYIICQSRFDNLTKGD